MCVFDRSTIIMKNKYSFIQRYRLGFIEVKSIYFVCALCEGFYTQSQLQFTIENQFYSSEN